MEQIIVIILFHQDHLLHKNKEERRKGTWPRISTEHYPAGDIYLLASCLACEALKGWCTQPVEGARLTRLCPWVAETATWSAFASPWTLLSPSLPVVHSTRIRARACTRTRTYTGYMWGQPLHITRIRDRIYGVCLGSVPS